MKASSPAPAFTRLDGLIAAPFTPFDRHGDLNTAVIRQQARLLVRSGVAGAYVCGTTGEGVSCSVTERKAVLEEWVRCSRGRLLVIAHVGALSIRDVEELAVHARATGADALSVVPASYFKPASVEALVAYLARVAGFAPTLPFYYYHTAMSGVDLPMVKLLEAAEGRIPNLAGIKFNDPDLYEYQNCARVAGGRYDLVWGIDEFFAGAVALGAKAAIGSTYNYAAPLYRRIRKDVEAGRLDRARRGMTKVCAIVDLLFEYGGIAAGKAMMGYHGIDVGDPRLPIQPLTARQKQAIVSRLRAILG